jgi:hypothetical protein
VTDLSPSTSKVTTMGTVYGPKDVAVGALDQIYYFDHSGLLNKLDLRPWVPCGNVFDYAAEGFSVWKLGNMTQAPGSTTLTQAHRVFSLRRFAASKSASLHKWDSMWRKKAVRFAGNSSHLTITKSTACFRARGYAEYTCCVRKDVLAPDKNQTSAEERMVAGALLTL